MLNELIKMVNECDDIIAVKNAFVEVLENIDLVLQKDELLFDAVRSAYNEFSDYHYTEELAYSYYALRDIDSSLMAVAKACYDKKRQDVNIWDWCVLYGRMSLNTKEHDARVNACNVFLANHIRMCELPSYI